jgi:hypothetical protein
MWSFLEKNSLKIVGFFFGLLSLLFSIQADIVVQSDSFFLWVPFKALRTKFEEKSLEKITKKAEKSTEQLKYIFVLDISQSLKYSGPTPPWYNEQAIKYLNDIISRSELQFSYSANPDPFDLFVVKIALLLIELKHKNVGLEIWEFGDNANIIFTKNKILKGSKKEIEQHLEERLIKSFESLIDLNKKKKEKEEKDDKKGLNTDFSTLFRRLCIKHKGLLVNSKLNKYKAPSFVLIILSDLLHDLKNRINALKHRLPTDLEKKNYFEERKKELMQKIAEVAEANTIANIILMAGPNDSNTNRKGKYILSLWEILNEKFVHSRLKKCNMTDKHDDILYSNIFTESALNFYYRNPVHINNSSTLISIPKGGNYRICLTWERKKRPDQIFTMEYEILDSNNQPVLENEIIVQGILSVNGEDKSATIPGYNYKIKLSYSGPPPQGGNIPYFKISYPKKDKVAFNIPIHFVKILPKGLAFLMVVLEIFLGAAIVLFIWFYLVKPKIKFYKIYRTLRSN